MSIKEFSQSHSVGIFYTLIVFVILTVIFSFMALSGGRQNVSARGNFNGQGMMQNRNGNTNGAKQTQNAQPTTDAPADATGVAQ
jgi:hypothetical protein